MPVLTEQDLQPTLPLNHARIGYDDHAGTYTATSARADSPAVAAKSWQTFERWRPTASPATLTKLFDTTQMVSYIGIGAATLSVVDSLTFEVLVDGEWVPIEIPIGLDESLLLDFTYEEYFIEGDITAADFINDNEAVMVLTLPRAADGVRVIVDYSGVAPSIGKLAAGEVLTMLRPFYQGHSPAMLSRDTVRTPSVSQGGEWLGTTIIRQGRSTSMAWQNLPASWYRQNFDPLVDHLQRHPCFAAWNPRQFPTDCIYAMATGDISPNNSGPRDLMSVTVDFKAYSDGTQPKVTGL